MPKNYHLHLTGFVGYWNFSKDQVAYILDQHKDEEVHVLIDSLGGYAYEALSISSLFKLHGNVHVHFIGANASAATIASMGAKRITIDADAIYLVHKCLSWVGQWGDMNEDDITVLIEDLEKLKSEQSTLNQVIANMYARRCKKDQAELMDLMGQNKFISAKQALEWGFVDEVTDDAEDKTAPLDKSALTAMAAAGLPLPPSAKGSMPGWLQKIISAFSPEPAQPVNEDDTTNPQAKESAQKPQSPMSKTFSLMAAALGASVAQTDGKYVFAESDLDKIEAELDKQNKAIADKEQAIADKDKTIADLENKVKDLSKEPASPTDTVTEIGADIDGSGPSGDLDKDVAYLMSL